MFVCICHSLTDSDVRSAHDMGAIDTEEVFWTYGIKEPLCECCFPEIQGMLHEHPEPKALVAKDKH
jgi:bacterioferritin-associated ferredoxin